MKLLLDANISFRLIQLISLDFDEVKHVDTTELHPPAKDIEIWNWSKKNGYIIITNDEDFLNLLLQKGFPPKIILLRTGNQSTRIIASVLIRHKLDIEELNDSQEIGILEIY